MGGGQPTSPQGPLCHDLAFVCHQTKPPVSLLALQRLRAVRLCIRSALQIDTTKIKKKKKKKWHVNPACLTCFCWPPVDVGLSHAVWLGRLKKCSKKDLGWGSLQKSSSSLSPIPGLPMTTAHPRYVSCHAQEGPAAKCSLTPAEQRAACPRSQAGRYPGRSCKGGLQGVLGLAQRSTETPGGPRSTAHGKMFQLLPCCL